MTDQALSRRRAIAYIDGCNLYFGLRDSGWQRYYWLDVARLAVGMLPTNSDLVLTKYFTTRVSGPPEKHKRQSDYLEALQTIPGCETVFGKFQFVTKYCQNCSHEERVPHEKMTDVNIAVGMLEDAFHNAFDTALLISGDSDLTPPVAAVRRLFPEKQVIVGFPPRRVSAELARASSSNVVIVRTRLRDSQMPDEIQKPDGYVLRRPQRWR